MNPFKSVLIRVRLSCGGRTRTCDLQVMSLASYQLLHSAIYDQYFRYFSIPFRIASAKVLIFFDMCKCLYLEMVALIEFNTFCLASWEIMTTFAHIYLNVQIKE